MKRPNIILYSILGFILKIFGFFKGQRIKKESKIVAPSIILSNHTSFFDFVYTTAAIYPKRINYLAAHKFFYDPGMSLFLKIARAIPKCLFQTDPVATMKTMKVLKNGGIIGIMPEGQISPTGVSLEFNEAIAKLVKKTKVPVYAVIHQNAYLVNPPWTKKTFKGKIESNVTLIASKEQVETLSEEELNTLIKDKMYFNTHEYNETRKMQVRLNSVKNLESVIYHCPVCGKDNLYTDDHALHCPDCDATFVYDQYGQIGGYRLDTLYRLQEKSFKQAIDSDPDFIMKSPVRLESYRDGRVKDVGSGTLTLNRFKYLFEGEIDGQKTTYEFSTKKVPTLPTDLGLNIQIYDKYILYQFVFENVRKPTQFIIAGEYLHQLAIK